MAKPPVEYIPPSASLVVPVSAESLIRKVIRILESGREWTDLVVAVKKEVDLWEIHDPANPVQR